MAVVVVVATQAVHFLLILWVVDHHLPNDIEVLALVVRISNVLVSHDL